jgi:multisubunit Na+/H+ antiporter MnhC subunit
LLISAILIKVNALIGFFLIAIFFLILFGIICAARSLREPNTARKIIGLIFNSSFVCILLLLIGFEAADYFSSTSNQSKNVVETINDTECIKAEIFLPDTIFRKKTYNGKILYNSCFDSINSELHTEQKTRTVTFVSLSGESNPEEDSLPNFFAKNNREIDFTIRYERAGQTNFQGIIIDFINLNSGTSTQLTDSTHIRTVKTTVNKAIFVK